MESLRSSQRARRRREDEARGDIRDEALVDSLTKGKAYVVHTAAALPLYSPEDIYSTDAIGTRVVMRAARRHGVKCAVQISSTAVYGIPAHHPLREDDKLEGVGPYGQANKDALERNLEWYKAHRHEFESRSGVTHRVPWKQGGSRFLGGLLLRQPLQ